MYRVPTHHNRDLPSYGWLFMRTLGYCFAALWIFSTAATYDEALPFPPLSTFSFLTFALPS